MVDVASLAVVINADTAPLEAGLKRAESSVSGFGSAISGAVTGVAVAGVAALGAAFVTSAKSAMDFEKELSAIQSVSGATGEQLASIRDTALQLGKDTSFSAQEAAAGMEELIKAGVSLKDTLDGGARAALDLAAASGTEVAESAAVMSNAMNAFALSGEQATHVADALTQASNASATSVHELGYSFSAVAAVAHTVGLSFDDTTVALAELAQAGLKGSDAGTSLKTMLINLNPSSKSAIAAMRELGIITQDGANQFFDAAGNAKSLADIQQVLQSSTANLTKEQKLNLLQTAFGTDALRAAAILSEQGAAGYQHMADAMVASGTAQDAANTRLNNLAGSWEKFTGSIETGAIMLGSLLTPTLKRIVDQATDAANGVIDAIEQIPDAIETVREVMAGDWAPDASIRPFTLAVGEAAVMVRDTFGPAIQAVSGFVTETLIPGVEAIAAPLAAFSAGFLATVTAATLAATAIAAVGAVLAFLVSPLGLVALAVGALAAAWTTDFLGIQEVVFQLVAIVQQALGGDIAGAFAAFMALVGTTTTQIAAQLVLWGQEFLAWVAPLIPPLLAELGRLASALLAWIVAEVPPLVQQLALWAAEFLAWVAPMIPPLLVELGKLSLAALDWIIAQVPTITAALVEWGLLFGAWVLTTAVPELIKNLPQILATIGSWVTTAAVEIGARVVDLGLAIAQGILTGFQNAWATIGPKIKESISSALTLPSWLGGGGGGGSGDAASYVRQAALARGLDPEQVAKVMMREGGAGYDAVGTFNTGTSYGPLQLHYAGGSNPQPGMGDAFTAATGIDLRTDHSVQAQQAAINYALDQLSRTGDFRDWYGADSALGSRFTAVNRVPPQVIAAQRGMIPQIGQGTLVGGTLTAAEAAAFCGPAAAMWFAGIYGRMPTKDEAEAMARQVGWTPEYGMAGPSSEQRLLQMMGVGSNVNTAPTPAEIGQLAGQNVPFLLSTAGHYYQVQGGSLAGLNVGASGLAAGGSAVMSLDQIVTLSGAINGVITLAPQMGAALTAASAEGGTAFTTLAAAAVAGGGQLVTAATDAMGNVTTIYGTASGQMTAIVTNAAGQVTATFSGLNTAVVADSATMAAGVTEQTATMSAGVTASVGEMSAGVLTSVTDLGGATMTITQDMAGTTVATITDMAGNVLSQYTQMASDATTAATDMSAGVVDATTQMATGATEQVATMSSDVLTSVTDLGGGILTITQDTAGNYVATITDMAGNVTSTYTSMAQDVTGTNQEMADTVVETLSNASSGIQGAVEDWGSSIGDELGNIADDAADAASEIGSSITDGIASGIEDGSGDVSDAVRDVVKEAIDDAKDEAESDSPSRLFARELGLPIAQGVAAGITDGYADVADATRGLVAVPSAPSYAGAGAGGGTQTFVVQVAIGDRVAEELWITGQSLALRRGRQPDAGQLGRDPLT